MSLLGKFLLLKWEAGYPGTGRISGFESLSSLEKGVALGSRTLFKKEIKAKLGGEETFGKGVSKKVSLMGFRR